MRCSTLRNRRRFGEGVLLSLGKVENPPAARICMHLPFRTILGSIGGRFSGVKEVADEDSMVDRLPLTRLSPERLDDAANMIVAAHVTSLFVVPSVWPLAHMTTMDGSRANIQQA